MQKVSILAKAINRKKTFCPSSQDKMLHMALRCLEGSTMSNLVHRRRRCARIGPYMILLPGGQYATG